MNHYIPRVPRDPLLLPFPLTPSEDLRNEETRFPVIPGHFVRASRRGQALRACALYYDAPD